MTKTATAEPEKTSVGEGFVGRTWLVVFVALLLFGALFTLLQLWIFWPTALDTVQTPARGVAQRKWVQYLWFGRFKVPTEMLFFIIIALSGALGGLIHAVRSLSRYIGSRQLRWSWVPFYFLLPLVGVLGGTVFYIVLRAGLFSPSTSVDQASPFGFSAVAALVGLFSEQAMLKLRDVAQNVFTPAEPGADHIDSEPGG